MAAPPPRREWRRRRRGSLERPLNARLYRTTWSLVALPLLVAAFSVSRPQPLPASLVPPSFDRDSAHQLANELAGLYPDRFPGSGGARAARKWLADELASYGFRPRSDRFRVVIPGHGRATLENVVAVVPGRSHDAIVVMAHRDNDGRGPGANDNASGTAALVELARINAPVAALGARRVRPFHTLVFVSSDGGAFGGIGAQRFAETSPYRRRIVALLDLDAIAGAGRPRLVIAGDAPRSPPASLVRTIGARTLEQALHEARPPSAPRQLLDLAFPFSVNEQAPFVARGVPAVTITTLAERPPSSFADTPARLEGRRLAEVGRSAEQLVRSLDQGLDLEPGTASSVWFGTRVVPGWALQLVLAFALLPFLAAAIDLFARCRRRRIALGPAFASLATRAVFWTSAGVLFAVFALVGLFPDGTGRPPAPTGEAARDWPLVALLVLGAAVLAAWFAVRPRLVPRAATGAAGELAGETAALLALGVVALLVVATNPFALVLVLPSLHAWLWLPEFRGRRAHRLALFVAGLAGPALLVGSFALRFGLGADAPWYLAELVALGYVPLASGVLFLGWLTCAGQLAALAAGRYAPYERGRRGGAARRGGVPWRSLARSRGRRTEPVAAPRALEG